MNNRRSFLKTFAGTTCAAAAARFLVRTAEAGAYPTRFLYLFTPHGRDQESVCSGTGSNFTLGAGLSALEPFKKKLLILDGVNLPDHGGEEHPAGRCSMLTGWKSTENVRSRGQSIDIYMADKLTQGQAIYAGVEAPGFDVGNLNQSISWFGANKPNQGFIASSNDLIKKLFNGVTPAPTQPSAPAAMTMTSNAAADELALNDYLMSEVSRLEKVVPAAQAEKLHLHLQTLAQVRAGIMPTSGGGGTTPPAQLPSCNNTAFAGTAAEAERLGLVMAQAFACGRSRIGALSLGPYDPHHEYSHWTTDGAGLHDKLLKTDRDFSAVIAKILGHLDSITEGSGTVLDNTIVVWSSEVSGTFNKAEDIHGTVRMPFVLAGGLGGKIKMGQRVVVSNKTNGQLYRAIAQQMGVADPSDFGEKTLSTGMLSEILV
ncbi:MAG: DUF1552 domain-containing protein [Deltaproteobacteria bacterium]|nr:DUF1552 domain-containing protein [Deltaproteobacteria bacterium]